MVTRQPLGDLRPPPDVRIRPLGCRQVAGCPRPPAPPRPPLGRPLDSRLASSPHRGRIIKCGSATSSHAADAPRAGSAAPSSARLRRRIRGPGFLALAVFRDSVWNLRSERVAVYGPGEDPSAFERGHDDDPDVIIMDAERPMTPSTTTATAGAAGAAATRKAASCSTPPIPAGFSRPGAGSGSTPNFATAFLLADGHTLKQGQPMADALRTGTATLWWYIERPVRDRAVRRPRRLDALEPRRHAPDSGSSSRRRDPPCTQDQPLRARSTSSTTARRTATAGPPSRRTAAPPAATEGPSPRCAWAPSWGSRPPSTSRRWAWRRNRPKILVNVQDYGAYVVDDTALVGGDGNRNGVRPARPHRGRVPRDMGLPIDPAARAYRGPGLDASSAALGVIDTGTPRAWATVSASNGTLGAGLGAPRVAWAPSSRRRDCAGYDDVPVRGVGRGAVVRPSCKRP